MSQASFSQFRKIPESQAGLKIKAGGAGTVYHDSLRSDMVLKILKPHNRTVEMEAKLLAMLSNPPMNQTLKHQGQELVQIAWPQELVVGARGEFVGFTMRLLDLSFANELFCWMDPGERKALGFAEDDRLRVNLAANLAITLGYLHSVGHAFVDLKGINVMAYRDLGYVCLIDCDGFRITHQGKVFPADLYTENYLAPEHQSSARSKTLNKADVGEFQDRFALALLVFELLDNATHPFSGIDLQNPNSALTTGELIFRQRTFLDPASQLAPPPTSHFSYFPDDTLQMFRTAFLGPPNQRPSAKDWRGHLEELVTKRMHACANNPNHSDYGKGCPWCSTSAAYGNPNSANQFPPPSPHPSPAPPSSGRVGSAGGWPSGSGAAFGGSGSAGGFAGQTAPSPAKPTIGPSLPPPWPGIRKMHVFLASAVVVVIIGIAFGRSVVPSVRCIIPGSCTEAPANLGDRTSKMAAELAALDTNPVASSRWGNARTLAGTHLLKAQTAIREASYGQALLHLSELEGAINELKSIKSGRPITPPPSVELDKEIGGLTNQLNETIASALPPLPAGWADLEAQAKSALTSARIAWTGRDNSKARQDLSLAARTIEKLNALHGVATKERQAVESQINLTTERLNSLIERRPPTTPEGWVQSVSAAERSLADAKRAAAEGRYSQVQAELAIATKQIDFLLGLGRRAEGDRQRLEGQIATSTGTWRSLLATAPNPRPSGWAQLQSAIEASFGSAASSLAQGDVSGSSQHLGRAEDAMRRIRELPSVPTPTVDPIPADVLSRLNQLQVRAQVIIPRLDSLRERQRALNLDLRADMANAELQMKQALRLANEAVVAGRLQPAVQSLSTAQSAIEKLERFLNI